MNRPLSLLGLCAALATALPAAAATETFRNDPAVAEFARHMARTHGFDDATLAPALERLRVNGAVLRAILPPSTPAQRSWERYRARFLTPQRITAGQRFIAEHGAALRRAEALYGVPAEIIAAIIGVETEYGRNMGRFGVAEALATLAFRYPPRADFFRRELEEFLLLARDNALDPWSVKGSYAGAIGIPQFMPSSQRRYAVDFDQNGAVDLRRSATDAIGSVASFLAQHGWETGAPVAIPVRIDGDPAPHVAAGILPQRALGELGGVIAAGEHERKAALIDLATPEAATEYWAGFQNFYVLTRYNRSSFYAMSVFLLAQELRGSVGR